jgi:hypothetical protein
MGIASSFTSCGFFTMTPPGDFSDSAEPGFAGIQTPFDTVFSRVYTDVQMMHGKTQQQERRRDPGVSRDDDVYISFG